MIGVELVEDRETKKPAHDLRERVEALVFHRGLLLMGCGKSSFRFCPPLSLTHAEVDEGLSIFSDALAAAEKE
jgi:4-aminobutyrate aminotransferase